MLIPASASQLKASLTFKRLGKFSSISTLLSGNTPSRCNQTTAIIVVIVCLCAALPARASDPQPIREATIQPETKAQLTIQSRINTKLSEADDVITATLNEPIFVDGEMVLARGAEFYGRIVKIAPAKRRQRSSHLSINFDRVVTSSGSVPISAQVTAIDNWDREEAIKADAQGKMKGGRRGEKTVENMRKGSSLGFSAGFVGLLLGGAAGASGRQALGIGGVGMAAGMIGGILFTKGNEIRVAPGSILRIKFLKPATIPVAQKSSESVVRSP